MQRNRTDITTAVFEVLAAELGVVVGSIGLNDAITSLPGANVTRIVRSITRLERQLGVTVPDEDLFSARIVGDLVDLVAGISAPKGTAASQ
ncbi:acyl carrier protein [Mycobacterium sp. AT1]|uniref:acyl carrier protein n=1 Tax=Mycobacterium sp. AT1 TaxID=1961706 RepID=UPI0009AE86CD|nr:hypothetical protein B1790_09690 [Mycobacterium sp. AT1]